MNLTTETRYGARALVELARNHPNNRLTINEIAARQNLPPKYLEQIFRRLKKGGLVKSTRGGNGGYELSRPPAEVRLDQVYAVLEGSPAVVHCVDAPQDCPLRPICCTHELWGEITQALQSVLKKTTLQDLSNRLFHASRGS